MNNDKDEKEKKALEELKKAADVAQKGAESHADKAEATAVLDKTAEEAKKAESFDHGKHDAGAKE